MSANDWRQACRMAFGAFAGWTLATLLAWPYAVYYAVYPLVLIGLAPAFDRHIALQFLVSAPTGMVAAGIMVAVLSTHPVVMTAAYLGFVSICFWLMTSPRKLFMFGALSLAISSGLVHYGSYPQMLWEELFWAACGSIVCSVSVRLPRVISSAERSSSITLFHSRPGRPAQRTRTPIACSSSRRRRITSRLKPMRKRTSSGERFQFSVENAYALK